MKNFLDNVPFMRTVSWVIGQMSHLKDSPLFKETAWDLFPALWELAKNEDSEVCINAVWGLGYLSDGDIDLLMNFDKNVGDGEKKEKNPYLFRLLKPLPPTLPLPILNFKLLLFTFLQIVLLGMMKSLKKLLIVVF